MTVKIEITADTVSEALEQARELGGDGAEELKAIMTKAPTFDGSPLSKERAVEMFGKGSPVERTVNAVPPNDADTNRTIELSPPPPLQVVPEMVGVTHPVATDPMPPSVTTTTEPTRDARGIPWDARIHGGTEARKAIAKDGSWKKRRGISVTEHTRVEAELRATATTAIPAIAALPTADAPPPPPPPPPETEPPPVTFGQLLAAADQDIAVLNDAVSTVSNGEITTIGLVADKAAWIQAVYDYLQQRS